MTALLCGWARPLQILTALGAGHGRPLVEPRPQLAPWCFSFCAFPGRGMSWEAGPELPRGLCDWRPVCRLSLQLWLLGPSLTEQGPSCWCCGLNRLKRSIFFFLLHNSAVCRSGEGGGRCVKIQEEMIQSDTLRMGLHSQSTCMPLSQGFTPFQPSPSKSLTCWSCEAIERRGFFYSLDM